MAASDFDVVVVGNVGIDTNVYFHGGEPVFGVESNFTENLDCVGQAGGYASRGHSQLGRRTAFIGHVGDDANGRVIRDCFIRDGIDSSALFTDPAGTARSVNLMYGDGRRKNFYDGKGHLTLQPDLNICRRLLDRARLAHFNLPNWARQLLPIAKKARATIVCDLQDVVTLFDGYRDDFIEHADIVFFSAANSADPEALIAELLHTRETLIVVAGMGARGCALGTRDGIRRFAPVAMEAPVVDSNGAGDSLAVGFLDALVFRGDTLEKAVLCGQIAARHACTLKGTSDGLITPELMRRYLERLG